MIGVLQALSPTDASGVSVFQVDDVYEAYSRELAASVSSAADSYLLYAMRVQAQGHRVSGHRIAGHRIAGLGA